MPGTVVTAAAVFAATTTTVPGWRTVWVNATTHSLWPTWHCSWLFCCGAYAWHGRYLGELRQHAHRYSGSRSPWDPAVPSPDSPSLSSRSGLQFFQPWGLWLRSTGLLFTTFLLLSFFALVVGLLLASHLYLVARNTTTWEFISSHRIAYLRQRTSNPFDRGPTRNLAHFFCGWPSGPWESLWAEEEEEGSSQVV